MNEHNNNSGHKGMMWIMIVCCAVPLIAVFFIGDVALRGGYVLPALIGVFMIWHFWMMFREHRTNEHDEAETSGQLKSSTEHKQGGSCH